MPEAVLKSRVTQFAENTGSVTDALAVSLFLMEHGRIFTSTDIVQMSDGRGYAVVATGTVTWRSTPFEKLVEAGQVVFLNGHGGLSFKDSSAFHEKYQIVR